MLVKYRYIHMYVFGRYNEDSTQSTWFEGEFVGLCQDLHGAGPHADGLFMMIYLGLFV